MSGNLNYRNNFKVRDVSFALEILNCGFSRGEIREYQKQAQHKVKLIPRIDRKYF